MNFRFRTLDQIGLRIRRAGHKFRNLFIVIVGR
jgi:hypothetical protein